MIHPLSHSRLTPVFLNILLVRVAPWGLLSLFDPELLTSHTLWKFLGLSRARLLSEVGCPGSGQVCLPLTTILHLSGVSFGALVAAPHTARVREKHRRTAENSIQGSAPDTLRL